MLRFLRGPVCASLSRLPLGRLAELGACRPLSLFYHIVFDEPPPYFAGLYEVKSPAVFEAEIDGLLQAGMVPVSLEHLLAAETVEDLPRRSFFLSFDDGYRELAETIAPILSRKGVPATFFLCSSAIDNAAWLFEDQIGLIAHRLAEADEMKQREVKAVLRNHGHTLDTLGRCRIPATAPIAAAGEVLGIDWEAELERHRPYLTSDQIRKLLGEGFAFGAHSIDHPLFATLDEEEGLRQIRESIDAVARDFGLPYRVFAFPYGEFGLPRAFLERVRTEGLVDAVFGTRGLVDDELAPFVRQRLWAEDHPGTFRRYLGDQLAEKVIRRVRGRDLVRR